jgi:hypothetical protein
MSWKRTLTVTAFAIGLNGIAQAADRITPPAVPETLEVDASFKPVLAAHAVGTQNYICAPAATASGVDWLFIGPQATLFGPDLQQIATHFQSRNPWRAGAIQATWQHSRDTSAVWATKLRGSTDSNYVAPDAIEWLLLEATGTQIGVTGGVKLSGTVYIQRVNTVGGIKPPAGECTAATINTRKLVPYEADYYFYAR